MNALTNFSAYNGKISNSGHDERGLYRSGKAGDQTGSEWRIRSWYKYSRGWNCVIRFNDPKIARMFATLEIRAAENNNVGYDMTDRLTYWEALQDVGYDPSEIKVACEEDCSAGILANAKAALILTGHKTAADKIPVKGGYTGNMVPVFKSTGLVTILTGSAYLTGYASLRPGDILLNTSHHTCAYVGGTFGEAKAAAATSGTGKSSTSTKTTAKKGSAPSYKVGRTYTTVASDLQVRTGAGTNYRRKKWSELTKDGRAHDTDKDGAFNYGTRVTCLQIKRVGSDIWLRCPSGWIAGYFDGYVYVK